MGPDTCPPRVNFGAGDALMCKTVTAHTPEAS